MVQLKPLAQQLKQIRDDAQNTTNPAILLVVYNVIPILIGPPPAGASLTSIMYHVVEGTRPCPFPVTGNGHGRVTEPQGYQFSGRDLGLIP